MNSTQRQKILALLNTCINSEIDLMTFCEEFSFYAFHLEDDDFKTTCTELLNQATDYMLNNSDPVLSFDNILKASELFDLIRKTYHELTDHS